MKKRIYVIDDEKDLQEILQVNLAREGYDIKTFSSSEDALQVIDKDNPDLILLDIMMDGMDGYDFCKEIRSSGRHKSVPIIFISVKSDEIDKILGLELGGDDYITKPFSIKELISRVKALLRRSDAGKDSNGDAVLRYKGIELHPEKYLIKVDGNNLKVTKTEFELLHLFMKFPEKVFTRDNIIDSIKGEDIFVIDRTIDVHIMNLRKKLGKYKNIISTFPGIGYGLKG